MKSLDRETKLKAVKKDLKAWANLNHKETNNKKKNQQKEMDSLQERKERTKETKES